MRPGVAVALAALLGASTAGAQVCTPSRGASGYRAAMTRRAPGAVTVPNLSVATLMAWSPPARAEHGSVRERDEPIDERESAAATLEGDVWRVKVGDDGCDLQLEVTAVRAGSDSPRVVARIPAGAAYDEARATLLAAGRGRVELREPVRVRLTGYVFWNGNHWCERNEGRGCGHRAAVVASLWELRPVWRVEVVDGSPPRAAAAEEEDGGRRHRRRHGHHEGRGHHGHHEGRRHHRRHD